MTQMQITLYRALLDAGMAQDKATTIVEGIESEITNTFDRKSVLFATKDDISGLKVSMAQLETKLANVESSLIKWNVGTILAGMAIMFAALRLLPH